MTNFFKESPLFLSVEKRFKFIRNKNPFQGLEDYLAAEELRTRNRKIRYPLQLSLGGFKENDPSYGLRVRLGYYFELLTQGIYGGRLKGCQQLDDANGSNLSDHNIVTSEPDVISDEKNYLRESKAVSPGGDLKIDDRQLAKYTCLQLGGYLPAPPRITFEIFRHGVRQLISNFREKPLEDLVDVLSTSTRFMLSLPLSIVVAVHKSGEDHFSKYTSRYKGDKWGHNSKLLSSGLNAIIAYPKETLSQFGLNPEDYNIWKLKFPKGIKANTKEIEPFPILLVRDKDHGKWIETLREQGSERHPILFRLKSQIDHPSDE